MRWWRKKERSLERALAELTTLLDAVERELETRTQQWEEAERAQAQADAALSAFADERTHITGVYAGPSLLHEIHAVALAAARQRQEGRG